MIREYRTVEEIVSPLMMVRQVEGVTYDELVEVELHDGSIRRGKVLEVNGDTAVVQLFESAAGINQTRHQILLHVDVYTGILLPGFTASTKVSNEIAVAETVIVGGVPQTYTYFSTTEDKIEDYADEYIMNNG